MVEENRLPENFHRIDYDSRRASWIIIRDLSKPLTPGNESLANSNLFLDQDQRGHRRIFWNKNANDETKASIKKHFSKNSACVLNKKILSKAKTSGEEEEMITGMLL